MNLSAQLRTHSNVIASENDIQTQNRIIREEQFQGQESENLGWAGNYDFTWSPRFSSSMVYASSRSKFEVETEISFKDPNSPGAGNSPVKGRLENDFNSNEFTFVNTWKGNSERIRFGMNYQYYESRIFIEDNGTEKLKLAQDEDYAGVFLEIENHWSDKFASVMGVNRYQDLASDQTYWMNKVLLQYKWTDRVSLRASQSLQYQFYNKGNFENVFGQNFNIYLVPKDNFIPVNQVQKWMLGTQMIMEFGKFNIEPFYTSTEGLLNISDIRAGFRNDEGKPIEYFLDSGEGNSYGLDVSFDASYHSYRSIIEYTWSKAEVNYNRLYKGATLPSFLDRRHQIAWSQQWSKNQFNFTISNTYKSGTPYLDFRILSDQERRETLTEVSQLLERLPFFYSLDVDVSYDFKIGNAPSALTFSLINATDRSNINTIIQSGPKGDNMLDLNFLSNTENLRRQVNVGFRIRI